MTGSIKYRRALADRLRMSGDLRSAAWMRAVERVPRELFIGPRFLRPLGWPAWEEVRADSTAEAEWLSLVYEDRTLVTQVGGAEGALTGPPTSSSTMPGLVVRMLEDLDVRDGHRVLEIGTGTGYSTALLSERLGAGGLLVSVEVDVELASHARKRLGQAGYHPAVRTGDGLQGRWGEDPFDRLIATCAVRSVPPDWLAQTRPGGRILTTVVGSLNAYGYVALDVTSPGRASGHFLPGSVSFMPARAHVQEPWTQLPQEIGETRAATVGLPDMNDWTGRFVAQTALPEVRFTSFYGQDHPDRLTHVFKAGDGSTAWLHETELGWHVTEHGPTRLWAMAEKALSAWNASGCPSQDHYGLTVTPEGHHIWLSS